MKTTHLFRPVALFVALTIAGVCLIVLPLAGEPDAVGRILPFVGSALFAGGLAFFLVETANRKGGA